MKREDVVKELNELIHDSPVRLPAEVMKGLKDARDYVEKESENDALENFMTYMYEKMFDMKITNESLAFVNYWINKYQTSLKKENDHE